MQDIIKWLLKNEEAARQIYKTAAAIFRKDKHLCDFLETLSEDEALHVQIMETALHLLQKETILTDTIIRLDDETRNKVDGEIAHIREMIATGNLTKKAMTEYIIRAELSEWNHLFMYVVNALKQKCPGFSTVGPKLQHHLRCIDRYMETTGESSEARGAFQNWTPVWDEGILIIDDSPEITELLAEFLSRTGNVETAPDGAEALMKAIRRYYAVIISDINMPVMNGIDFFNNLESFYKNVADRFIFMTGFPTPDVVKFCRTRNIPLVRKPFKLNELNDCVYKLLESNIRRKPLQELACH